MRTPFTMTKTSPLFCLLLAACGGAESVATSVTIADLAGSPFPAGTGPLDRAGAEQRALDLVGGTILASESETERGLEVWEVEVRRASGAVVEVDVVAASGDILEIECERHIAGEDLAVEPGYLSLADAIAAATSARAGDVVAWELELDDVRNWTWELELVDADGDKFEVEVDATSGAVELDHDGDDSWDDDEMEDDDYDDDRTAPPSILAKSTALLQVGVAGASATVTEVELDDGTWEVELTTPSGADVEVELTMNGRVVDASGEDGPFDYDVVPPGLVPLSEALTAAGRAAAELEEWELDRENGDFVWSLDFEDREVDVDAVTGAVL